MKDGIGHHGTAALFGFTGGGFFGVGAVGDILDVFNDADGVAVSIIVGDQGEDAGDIMVAEMDDAVKFDTLFLFERVEKMAAIGGAMRERAEFEVAAGMSDQLPAVQSSHMKELVVDGGNYAVRSEDDHAVAGDIEDAAHFLFGAAAFGQFGGAQRHD